MNILSINYLETGAMVLFGIGLVTLLFNNNLIKKVIGLNIMDTSIFLFFITRGYIRGREAPIIRGVHKGVNGYINPVPTALMLTGIVVAVSITAFILSLAIKLNEEYGTINLDAINQQRRD